VFRPERCAPVGSFGISGSHRITIRSSRSCFAARLNSGVRPHMRSIASVAIAIALCGCSKSYTDLESAFAVEKISNTAGPLKAKSITITSQRRTGATSYNGVATIRASADSIDLEIGVPFTKPLSIPASEIAGCSMTCFGPASQNVDLLIPKTGTDLMIPGKQLLDWCWSNSKPMFSSSTRRQWRHSGATLPTASDYREQLSSRAAYDKQVQLSCAGY
jgi:hypothetical protein